MPARTAVLFRRCRWALLAVGLLASGGRVAAAAVAPQLRDFNSTAIELAWPVGWGARAAEYHVFNDEVRVLTLRPPATRALVTGLTPRASVEFHVRAVDGAGVETDRTATVRHTVADVPFPRGKRVEFAGHYAHTEVVLPMEEALASLNRLLETTPAIAGVSIKLWWKTLHPEKGRIRWDLLEQMLAACARRGKKAHLTLFPGMNSPEWIFGEGVPRVGPVTVGGRSGETPVVWHPRYTALFTADLRELARRHADDPRLDSIQVTGHNYKGGEMHAPKSDTVGVLAAHGFSRATVLQDWKYWIDTVGTLFRRQKLNLVVSQMYPSRANGEDFSTLPEEVAAYFVERYQGRAILQTMQLNGRESADRGQLMSQEICLKFSALAPNCHEMVGSFKTQPDRQGTPEMMIFNFVRQGNPLYLQYWRADAGDPELIAQIETAWRTYGGMEKDALAARLKAEGRWIETSTFERAGRQK